MKSGTASFCSSLILDSRVACEVELKSKRLSRGFNVKLRDDERGARSSVTFRARQTRALNSSARSSESSASTRRRRRRLRRRWERREPRSSRGKSYRAVNREEMFLKARSKARRRRDVCDRGIYGSSGRARARNSRNNTDNGDPRPIPARPS